MCAENEKAVVLVNFLDMRSDILDSGFQYVLMRYSIGLIATVLRDSLTPSEGIFLAFFLCKIVNSIVEDSVSVGASITKTLNLRKGDNISLLGKLAQGRAFRRVLLILTLIRRKPSVGQLVAFVGTESFHASKLIRGFGSSNKRLGGMRPFSSMKIALMSPARPAAASRWPI